MVAGRRIRRTLTLAACAVLIVYAAAVALRVLYPLEDADRIRAHAAAAHLDPALVSSLIRAESRFRPAAVSPRGARGLMQLMPDTAAWIAGQTGTSAPDLFDPETNLRLGTWYLHYLLGRFGRLDRALAAYNAGPTRVEAWLAGEQKEFPETEAFVRRVLRGVPVYRFMLRAPLLVRITPSLDL